jgi:hypothetical protein
MADRATFTLEKQINKVRMVKTKNNRASLASRHTLNELEFWQEISEQWL